MSLAQSMRSLARARLGGAADQLHPPLSTSQKQAASALLRRVRRRRMCGGCAITQYAHCTPRCCRAHPPYAIVAVTDVAHLIQTSNGHRAGASVWRSAFSITRVAAALFCKVFLKLTAVADVATLDHGIRLS